MTHALAIHTHATVVAVARTSELTAVLPSEAVITIAGSIDAASAIVAVIWTDELGAVKARPWMVANTLILHTSSTA